MQESQFDHDAVSERGAIGLMQLMPVTNAEILEDLDLEGNQLPEENIIAGTYYVSKLLGLFKDCSPEDRLRLMLASYNAGPSRIYDAQELGAYMGEDPRKWSTIEHMLPLLSKRYYSLHSSVWQSGKPRSGYFGSWRQTLAYVDNTMKIYQTFSKELQ
jgi:membrane-bound lytic murein transglycosylase F